MKTLWITFRSLTHAQRAVRALERKGITATLTRLPQGLSTSGCGYAVVFRRRAGDFVRILSDDKIPYGKFFIKDESGEFQELKE